MFVYVLYTLYMYCIPKIILKTNANFGQFFQIRTIQSCLPTVVLQI